MNDDAAIQYALYRGLRSCALFRPVNVMLGLEYLASKTLQDAVWMMPSPGGQKGVGAIVQIPTVLFPKPNGLQRDREYSIGFYEEPNANFTPGVGTFKQAIDWADRAIDFGWNWILPRAGGLKPQERCVVPDTRFAEIGIVGHRAVFVLRQERRQPPRCATPVITFDGDGNVAIVNTDGADIYYTTDGFSAPAPDNNGSLPGEQAAAKYIAGFNVAPGTHVHAMSWFADPNAELLPSQSATQIIN